MRKIIIICLLFLYGCAATVQSRLDNIQNNFAKSDFEITDDSNAKDQSNLDLLINGSALFHANKFKESDLTFEEFNKRNLHETSSSISREAAGLLLGQGVNSYKPYMMDSLFVSYYQIWDLLAQQDFNNVRVVINQSYERQKNMSRQYEKMIEENKNRIYENEDIKEFINKNTSDWLAFREIMNPALMYLSGIYFLDSGDFDNAITYLKRASGMMPENKFIKQDLEMAQKRQKPKHTTWQFIETGFAPRLTEDNGGIFVFNVGMVYFTFTSPYFDNDNYVGEYGRRHHSIPAGEELAVLGRSTVDNILNNDRNIIWVLPTRFRDFYIEEVKKDDNRVINCITKEDGEHFGTRV